MIEQRLPQVAEQVVSSLGDPPLEGFLGELQCSWQFHASSSSEHLFKETAAFTRSCAANQAHFRSHSSPGSGDVFLECPTGPEFPGRTRSMRDIGV